MAILQDLRATIRDDHLKSDAEILGKLRTEADISETTRASVQARAVQTGAGNPARQAIRG